MLSIKRSYLPLRWVQRFRGPDFPPPAKFILDSLAEPVLVLNADFRAMTANPAFCQIVGVEPEALVGKLVQDLIHDEAGSPHLRAVLQGVMVNGGFVHGKVIHCTTPDHTGKVLLLNARRFRRHRNLPEIILVELRDITQETLAADKISELSKNLALQVVDLEHANRELDSFAHTVSHDLRNPLRFMSRITHLLLDEHSAGLSADATELVDLLQKSTEGMAELIESLLEFSASIKAPMHEKTFNLRPLVDECFEDLKDEQQGRDVRIAIDDLGACRADRGLLKQVLLNLLENALKFTRECKVAEIRVGVFRNSDETVYFVRDNGLGFESGQSETMFLVFQRLEPRKGMEGSGIGLAVARRIINRHGGRIWAEGAPNLGATFYFTLGKAPAGGAAEREADS